MCMMKRTARNVLDIYICRRQVNWHCHGQHLTGDWAVPAALMLAEGTTPFQTTMYEALVPCDTVPPQQCCKGVGHTLLANTTVYHVTPVVYNGQSYKQFSLDISVHPPPPPPAPPNTHTHTRAHIVLPLLVHADSWLWSAEYSGAFPLLSMAGM